RLRGAEMLPDIPRQHAITGLPGQPRRARARPIRGDSVADELEPLIQPLLVADQPFEAETLFNARSAELSPEARTAFEQRIAWVYYLNNFDRDARRMAEAGAGGATAWAHHSAWVSQQKNVARDAPRKAEAGAGGVTEWAIHSAWVAGLAAWRLRDYAAAS